MRDGSGTRAAGQITAVGLFLAMTGMLLLWPPDTRTGHSALRMQMETRLRAAVAPMAAAATCPQAGADAGPESDAVALAILAGESTLRHPVEKMAESGLEWLGARLAFAPPDLSLGSAQISPGHYRKLTGSLDGYWATVADQCASLAFIRHWLAGERFRLSEPAGRRAAFSAWSGHPGNAIEAKDFASVDTYHQFFEALYQNGLRERLSSYHAVQRRIYERRGDSTFR